MTRKTIHLGVLDDGDVLYVEKLQGHERPGVPTRVGGRVCARTTALGKAMLAYSPEDAVERALRTPPSPRTKYSIVSRRLFLDELAEVRRTGFAVDREEVRLGLSCVAAPVIRRGQAVGAISVAGSAHDFDPAPLARRLRAVAQSIAGELI